MTNRNKNKAAGDYYPGYRHPKILIGYVVWSYHAVACLIPLYIKENYV